MQEQSEVTDEQLVKERYPLACAESDGAMWVIINDENRERLSYCDFIAEAEAWADARRRLETKPDAEAIFCPDPDCVHPAGHESDHSPSAQPKPDAAGEAKDGVWTVAILGQGGVGVGASRNKKTGAFSVLFQELDAPLEIGAKPDPNINPARDVIEVRIESVEAADVLLHAVQTVRDVLSGQVTWDETRATYAAMDRLPSAPRNSALEDAAKEMAEAIGEHLADGKHLGPRSEPLRAALARFHALRGE